MSENENSGPGDNNSAPQSEENISPIGDQTIEKESNDSKDIIATPEKKEEGEAKDSEAKDTKEDDSKKGELKKEVPETYSLTLPDGSPLKPEHVEKVAAYAKERGLSNEDAQAILERESEAVSSYVTGLKDEAEGEVKQWIDEIKSDKEIGGVEMPKNLELANRVLRQFFPPSFSKLLEQTQYGNHPDLIRGFVKLGKAMANDKFVFGKEEPQPLKSTAEVLYGQSR